MIPALPAPVAALRNARLADGTVADLRLDGPLVVAVESPGTTARGAGIELDLDGFVLLTAGAEPHAHLDKALTFDEIAPPLGDLPSAIASFHTYAITADEHDIADRARRTLGRMLANGVTAVRTHVNFSPGPDPLVGYRALATVRREFAGLVDLQIVTLPAEDTPDDVHEAAFALGADLVGGAPHLWPDPIAGTDHLLDLAEALGVGADLHADESLDGPITLARFAERAGGWSVGRSAGHCVRLGMLPPDELAVLVEAVRAADIGIIGLPITNLYLQGWEQPVATPRGLTALRALIDAGVRVAAGADNVRDPFNPLGRCDPLETAMLLVAAGHLSPAEALHLVGDGARDVLGLPAAGPRAGAVADLLAVRADTATEAIAFASADRYVLHAGRLVAASVIDSRVAEPARDVVLTATDPGAA